MINANWRYLLNFKIESVSLPYQCERHYDGIHGTLVLACSLPVYYVDVRFKSGHVWKKDFELYGNSFNKYLTRKDAYSFYNKVLEKMNRQKS